MNLRIGQGYDVHALAEGETLILGGIQLDSPIGTIAHSDGDVLTHAICDALLGAANMRDIGYHFPDTASENKNIDSTILLKKVQELIAQKGYSIINIDSTICLQKPKLKNHIEKMKHRLSEVLDIHLDQVSIKATTTEKLGFVGRQEGVEAHSIVLIQT